MFTRVFNVSLQTLTFVYVCIMIIYNGHQLLKSQVSKPYTGYFSEDNLKLLEVKEPLPEKLEAPTEVMDISMATDAISAAVADQEQPEDNYWGDAGEEDANDVGDD